MTGALLNVATVLVGGTVGLALKSRLPERAQRIGLRGLGVVTCVLGLNMIRGTHQPLVLVTALAAGMAIGTFLHIQRRLDCAAQWLQSRLARTGDSSTIAEGWVTTSLLFCVGPMTFLGSIRDGLTGDYSIIAVKALMDGVASLAFAATLGWGVLLSAGSVLVVQGGLTLGAGALSGVLTEPMVVEGSAVGGVLMLCIAVDLLGLRRLPVADYLPALVLAPLLVRWL